MYVCVCHAVTDSQVRQAVHNGVTLMRELREGIAAGRLAEVVTRFHADRRSEARVIQ